MKRRAFIRLISGLAIAWPLASYGQQPKLPLKRAGVLAAKGHAICRNRHYAHDLNNAHTAPRANAQCPAGCLMRCPMSDPRS